MALLLTGRVLVVACVLVACSSSCGCPVAAAAAMTTVDGITAIYSFGDSITDTGNLVREGATGMLRYIGSRPYGIDLLRGGRTPTGRCSNGYLMIDFLAKYLGLPLLNPYLDKAADFTHGVNFAVAGATALGATALAERGVTMPHSNSSLDVQLQWFRDFMASATTNSSQEVRRKLASSLVMLEIGGNDFNYAFLQLQTRPTGGGYGSGNVTRIVEILEQVGALVPQVVQSITNAAKALLEMGAVRVVVAGNLPIGCSPAYLSGANVTEPAAYDADGCLLVLNGFAELYNAALRAAVAGLKRAHPRAVVAYADYFAAYARVLREARARGFDPARTRTACCGAREAAAYGFRLGRFCGAPRTTVCADRARYVSWDGVHPTQHAYEAMTELLYRGGLACPPPINWPGQTMPEANAPLN